MKSKEPPTDKRGGWLLFLCISGPTWVVETERRFNKEQHAHDWVTWFLTRPKNKKAFKGGHVYSDAIEGFGEKGQRLDSYRTMRFRVEQDRV